MTGGYFGHQVQKIAYLDNFVIGVVQAVLVLWDFLGRIFVAYGFYQTIQAFRRYGRK